MKKRNRRGLSDVVATVLIIFLVVAAVVAIWAFIQPTLKSAGSGIQKGQVCLTSTVEPITCVYSGDGTTHKYTVGYRKNVDASTVASTDSIQVTLELESGAVQSGEGTDVDNGASSTVEITVDERNANQVSIASSYTLADGQEQVCTSVPLDCDVLA